MAVLYTHCACSRSWWPAKWMCPLFATISCNASFSTKRPHNMTISDKAILKTWLDLSLPPTSTNTNGSEKEGCHGAKGGIMLPMVTGQLRICTEMHYFPIISKYIIQKLIRSTNLLNKAVKQKSWNLFSQKNSKSNPPLIARNPHLLLIVRIKVSPYGHPCCSTKKQLFLLCNFSYSIVNILGGW